MLFSLFIKLTLCMLEQVELLAYLLQYAIELWTYINILSKGSACGIRSNLNKDHVTTWRVLSTFYRLVCATSSAWGHSRQKFKSHAGRLFHQEVVAPKCIIFSLCLHPKCIRVHPSRASCVVTELISVNIFMFFFEFFLARAEHAAGGLGSCDLHLNFKLDAFGTKSCTKNAPKQ